MITFSNDNGTRDVYFRSDVPTSIEIQNRIIQNDNGGRFTMAWNGCYTISFNGKNVMSIFISFNTLLLQSKDK